jgi:hypothetical protein
VIGNDQAALQDSRDFLRVPGGRSGGGDEFGDDPQPDISKIARAVRLAAFW